MKHNRLLSISISIAVLLSGCSTKQTPPSSHPEIGISGQSSEGKNARAVVVSSKQTKLLPNYVKHNPHVITGQSSVKTSNLKATITVQLVPLNDGSGVYIYYQTSDMYTGQPGALHWNMSGNNESHNCTIFKKFPSDAMLFVNEDNGEVIIKVSTKHKCYKWRSDSGHYLDANPDDSDVRWTAKKCP
jgi:hypothetical protein